MNCINIIRPVFIHVHMYIDVVEIIGVFWRKPPKQPGKPLVLNTSIFTTHITYAKASRNVHLASGYQATHFKRGRCEFVSEMERACTKINCTRGFQDCYKAAYTP